MRYYPKLSNNKKFEGKKFYEKGEKLINFWRADLGILGADHKT